MPVVTSLTIIAICQLIMTVGIVLAAAAIIYGIFAIKNMLSSKLDEAMSKVQPVVDRAESIARQARDTAENVSAKVDHIMSRAESTADTVSNRVESVSARVEQAVSPQVVTAAGVVGTAVKCLQIYQDIVKTRQSAGNGPSEPPTPCI